MTRKTGLQITLASGNDVGPTFINFGFFSRPYGLIREYIKIIYMVIYYIGHVYLRPYVYSFCQFFQALRLFPALRLFRRLEYLSFKKFNPLGAGSLGIKIKVYFHILLSIKD